VSESTSQSIDIAEHPVLHPVPRCMYEIGGAVGELLGAVTDQWMLVAPKANPAMLEMFADRDVVPFRDKTPWAGEFAGKYLTAAVQVMNTTQSRELKAWLKEFVGLLISRQAEDGYLGPWPRAARLTNSGTWDTWAHYHIMMGLMFWYEETGDAKALECACRIADLICEKYLGEKSPRLVDTGSTEMNLAPVHSLAILYRKTGNRRYLDMARQIVEEFGAKKDGEFLAGDYLHAALAGKQFFETPKPRWESLHPIMGLAELYWIRGEKSYRRAYEQIWWSIVEYDRHNNGGFSSGERATGNPYDPSAIETCCTIAWIAASVEMLKLTGDSVVADEIELSTLNSVMGMHSFSGRWATYNTPSDGARFASAHHIVFQARPGSPELNCCSVNSPRGLGMISDWAVMQSTDGVYLNYYGPSRMIVPLSGGVSLEMEQTTDYPASGRVLIDVRPSKPCELTIHFRIPYWSERAAVTLNGTRIQEVKPGSYLAIKRRWTQGDRIEIDLDMSLHFWRGERDCEGLVSVYRGPVLLAYDQRYNRARHAGEKAETYGQDPGQALWNMLTLPTFDARSLALEPATWDGWLPPHMLFTVKTADGGEAMLCDFASAGQTGSLYRSWLPFEGAPKTRLFSRANPLRSVR